jgi:hypothetical protein
LTAGTAAAAVTSRRAGPRPTRQIMRDRYPARAGVADWPTTRLERDDVWRLVTTARCVLDNVATQHKRRRGLTRLLDWLQDQPGSSWQRRWLASGAEAAGTQWRRIPLDWLAERGFRSAWLPSELSVALAVLVGADILRPSLAWLVAAPAFKPTLTEAVALGRDPSGFARLRAHGRGSPSASRLTAGRMAVIVAAKGGTITDVTVGDVLELADTETSAMAAWPRDLPVFYSTLKELGILGADAPARWRQLRTPGQRTPDELVDRYDIACQPVRDLLVEYLRERQPGLDYNSLRDLSYYLACCFWKDLEAHHPGIDSLRLTPQVAAGWRERVLTKPPTREHDPGLRISHRECLAKVRAFYLDLSQWALEDPARWAWWVAPCPIGADDLGGRKAKRQRKARMDARRRCPESRGTFGDDPYGCYAATPTVSAAAVVSGWACRYSAATSWGICL